MLRIVEAVDPVTGDAAEQKAVVMVLATQPAIVVQLDRQVNLVAGGAEFVITSYSIHYTKLYEYKYKYVQKVLCRRSKKPDVSDLPACNFVRLFDTETERSKPC